MWRKEIFFRKLSFIIGITLIVFFVEGTEVPLPLRSEIRLGQSWGDESPSRSELIINQERNEIHTTFFRGSIIKEGIVPIAEFKSFWDSLNSLNIWQLKEKYMGEKKYSNEIGGDLSVVFEKDGASKITKLIHFFVPHNCPEEFKKVYNLVLSMKKFAQNQPGFNELLSYGKEGVLYQGLASAEIGRINDPKYLDTLLILLPKEIMLADGIIHALVNIGDKKAIPILKQFLKNLDTMELPGETRHFFYLSREQLILTTLSTIISIEGEKGIKILKKYLNEKYGKTLRGIVSIMLTNLKDYSGIPILIDLLGDPGLNQDVFFSLRRVCYKNKRVITIFIKALEKEMKVKKLNDQRINGITRGLYEITDQSYLYNLYNPYDSLWLKKENINKWIEWWKENKNDFK